MAFVRVDEPAGGHHYEDGGRRVRGVTTWIGYGVPKKLTWWAARETAEYADLHWDELGALPSKDRRQRMTEAHNKMRRTAADTGTTLHDLADRISKGEDVDVAEAMYGMADGYVQWLDAFNVHVLATEMPVLHRTYEYAGTLDLIAEIAGVRWLLDIKTGSDVYAETALQLAAYRYAEVCLWDGAERAMPSVDQCGVVHVQSDAVTLRPVWVDEATFNVFLSAIEVGRWSYDTKSTSPIGRPVVPPNQRRPVSHYHADHLRGLGWQLTPPLQEAWPA